MSPLTTRERLDLRVLAAVEDRPPAHAVDLSESLDEHPVTVDEACVRLHRDGYLTTATRGLFTITERGTQYLERARAVPDDSIVDGRSSCDRAVDDGRCVSECDSRRTA